MARARRAARGRFDRPGAGRRSRLGPAGGRQGRPVRALRAGGRGRGRGGRGTKPHDGVAAGQHGPGDGDPGRRPQGAVAAPGRRRRPGHRARRSWPPTAATGRISRRAPTPGRSRREDQLFTVSLDEALALFAQPKTRRGRGAAAPPLRELGADPATGGADPAQGRPVRPVRDRRRRPTPRCARATPSRASPPSGRPSCWPTAGRPARPAKRAHGAGAATEKAGRRPRRRPAAKKAAATKKAARLESGDGQEGAGARRRPAEEGRPQRRPRRPARLEPTRQRAGLTGPASSSSRGARAPASRPRPPAWPTALGAVLTREPGGTATGERIRALLLDPVAPAARPRAPRPCCCSRPGPSTWPR